MARTNTNTNTGITAHTDKSIQGDGSLGNPIQLVNDVATPGVGMYYGTNGAGTKGFFNISAIILPPLANKSIWIGDSLNAAIPHVLSGDVSMSNTGVVTVIGFTPSALIQNHIFIGNSLNVATDVAVGGVINIISTGVTAFNTNSFSSADLRGALTDETGSGFAVFSSTPRFDDFISIGKASGTPYTGLVALIGKSTGSVNLTVEDAGTTYTLKLPTALGSGGQFFKQTTAGGSTAFASITAADITSGQAVTKFDDTNVTVTLSAGSGAAALSPYSMTLGWTGTLAAARLNGNVVQSVTSDTNILGQIPAGTQNLILGWAGTLARSRGGTGAATFLLAGIPEVVYSDTRLNQSADIGAQTMTTTAGLYRVSYYLMCLTSDITAGKVNIAIKYQDDAASQELDSAQVFLTTLGSFTQGFFSIELTAAASMTYQVNHVGLFGTARYSVYITLERLR